MVYIPIMASKYLPVRVAPVTPITGAFWVTGKANQYRLSPISNTGDVDDLLDFFTTSPGLMYCVP